MAGFSSFLPPPHYKKGAVPKETRSDVVGSEHDGRSWWGSPGVAWAGTVRHKPKPPKVIQVVPVEEPLHRQDLDSTG